MTVAMTVTKAAMSCVPRPGRAQGAARAARGAGVDVVDVLVTSTGAATVVGAGAPCIAIMTVVRRKLPKTNAVNRQSTRTRAEGCGCRTLRRKDRYRSSEGSFNCSRVSQLGLDGGSSCRILGIDGGNVFHRTAGLELELHVVDWRGGRGGNARPHIELRRTRIESSRSACI